MSRSEAIFQTPQKRRPDPKGSIQRKLRRLAYMTRKTPQSLSEIHPTAHASNENRYRTLLTIFDLPRQRQRIFGRDRRERRRRHQSRIGKGMMAGIKSSYIDNSAPDFRPRGMTAYYEYIILDELVKSPSPLPCGEGIKGRVSKRQVYSRSFTPTPTLPHQGRGKFVNFYGHIVLE